MFKLKPSASHGVGLTRRHACSGFATSRPEILRTIETFKAANVSVRATTKALGTVPLRHSGTAARLSSARMAKISSSQALQVSTEESKAGPVPLVAPLARLATTLLSVGAPAAASDMPSLKLIVSSVETDGRVPAPCGPQK